MSARGAAWLALAVLAAGDSGLAACTPPPPRCPELATADIWKDRLGAHTLADRGKLLACAHAGTVGAADAARSPFFPTALTPARSGFELFVVQYVTEGRPGVARAATALLYLPTGGGEGVPIVAVDHSLFGMGPACGPSHAPLITDPLAVPLAARGHAVVAPDYPGVGVDNGMTSFLVGTVEAASTLDGVRALRALRDPRFDTRRLGDDLFVVGHSQGGHAALFTHQRFDPAIGVRLRGSIAIAPALGDAREWGRFVNDAARPVGGMETAAAMTLYAHALHAGGPAPEAWLSPAAQEALPRIFHDECIATLAPVVAARFPTVGDLYAKPFVDAAAACSFQAPCPGFEPWASMLLAEQPGRISGNAPVLVLQGLADTVVRPGSVACVVDRMKAGGAKVESCGYPGANHVSVLDRAAPDVVRWIEAVHAGETFHVCAGMFGAACGDP